MPVCACTCARARACLSLQYTVYAPLGSDLVWSGLV